MAAALAAARQRLEEVRRASQEAISNLADAEWTFEEAKEEGADAEELKVLEDEMETAETIVDAVDADVNAAIIAVKAAAEAAHVRLCSHPECTNPAPYMCGKCRSAYYCCEEHQKDDWNRHKPECHKLSAKAGGQRKSRRSKRSKHSKRSTRKSKRRY